MRKKKISQKPLPRQPYTWPMITDGDAGSSERHIFYSLTDDRYHIRFVPDLHNMYVSCSYQQLLVLKDKSSDDCSILNILSMDKFQLPPLDISSVTFEYVPPICILSSPVIDTTCRIIFFEPDLHKFRSCHIGDTQFVEGELIYDQDESNTMITRLTNFKGKLYALANPSYNLLTSDFEDPGLYFEQVVSGESILNCVYTSTILKQTYLVDSCDDLLLIVTGSYGHEEVSDVFIFRADFENGEWVEERDLGDRAIFLGLISTFSSPASPFGLKGNALYWVRTPHDYGPLPRKHLYMYDLEDKSVTVSLPCPYIRALSSIFWLSIPVTTCNEEDKSKEQNVRSSLLFEAASPVQRTVCLNRQTEKTRKTQNNVEICSTEVAGTESLWSDIPTDIVLEIFPRLIAGEKVAFRCVCRSWYSVLPSQVTKKQHFVHPHSSSDRSSPFLMCPNNKIYHPFYDELYSLDGFQYARGEKVRAARDGWLLMDKFSAVLFFYNPVTKSKVTLPECDVMSYYTFYFIPPTSADFIVVVAALKLDNKCVICYMKNLDDGWTYREIPWQTLCFGFCSCNAVVHRGLFYFLGAHANLLVFDPDKDQIKVIDAPEFISSQLNEDEWAKEKYLLESDDGKLMAVFVGGNGSVIHICELNEITNEWEIIQNLGDKMLFVSRPLFAEELL